MNEVVERGQVAGGRGTLADGMGEGLLTEERLSEGRHVRKVIGDDKHLHHSMVGVEQSLKKKVKLGGLIREGPGAYSKGCDSNNCPLQRGLSLFHSEPPAKSNYLPLALFLCVAPGILSCPHRRDPLDPAGNQSILLRWQIRVKTSEAHQVRGSPSVVVMETVEGSIDR